MRRQGMMKMPARDVRRAPAWKSILPGAKLTSAFAGATMLAAMLVDRVATSRPARARVQHTQSFAQLRLHLVMLSKVKLVVLVSLPVDLSGSQ